MSGIEVLLLLFSGICGVWSRTIASSNPSIRLAVGHFSSEYYVLNMHASLVGSDGEEFAVVTSAVTRKSHGLEIRGDVSLADGRVIQDFLSVEMPSEVGEVGLAELERFAESVSFGLASAVRHPEIARLLAR